MKLSKTILLSTALVTLSQTARAEDYSLTVTAGHPPVFRWVRMVAESFEPALEQGFQTAGHSVTFSNQFGGAIASVGEELETVGAGLAEIGVCQSLFDPAKLALQNVTYYAPFVSTDVKVVSQVMNRLHRDLSSMTHAYDENDVVYLGAPIVLDDYLLMTDFPVTSLADLQGKKIAAPGAAVNWLSGTGAVGVSGNLTTYYNELATNVYDGVLVFASAALPGKLYEVAPHITRVGFGAQFAGALCANRDWYEDQPVEVQEALKQAADTAGAWYNADLEVAVSMAFDKMGEAGATITDASDEMRRAWAAGMDNAAKIWAEGLDAQGQPASEILQSYLSTATAAGAQPLRNWAEE